MLLQIARAAAKVLEHYSLCVIMVTLSECGVVVVRRGLPEDPLPTRPATQQSASLVSAVWYPGQPCPGGEVVSVSGMAHNHNKVVCVLFFQMMVALCHSHPRSW